MSNRVRADDLEIGDTHPEYGACGMLEGPVDGCMRVGWELHDSGWVSEGTLFTVTEGSDD